MKKLIAIILAALSTLCCGAFVSCTPTKDNQTGQQQALPLSVDPTAATLIGNESITITASNGFNDYSWSVDKTDCATLTQAGNVCQVTANADGAATLIVEAGGKKATCALTLQTTNLVRLTKLKAYFEKNLQLGSNDCTISTNPDGEKTSLNFATNVPTFTLHSGSVACEGSIQSIQFTPASIDTSSNSQPIVKQLLENSTITITYYYAKGGAIVTQTFEMYQLTYELVNDALTVSSGLMRNSTHFQSLTAVERNAIQHAALRLLSLGTTQLISGVKTNCNVNLCLA